MRSRLEAFLKTPAGCDGGNIQGNNWLFAIEYGGEADLSDYDNLVVDHKHGSISKGYVSNFISSYPFNQRIAKFETVKHGRPIEEYLDFAVEVGMFTDSSQYYKGNIGGLGFRFDDQDSFQASSEKLGISSKEELKELEIEIREKMFQGWVRENRPNSICCFGTSDSNRFIRAFSDKPENSECWRKLCGFWFYSEIVRDGSTALFILPHPTARFGNGMTTDSRITEFATLVRNTMIDAGLEIF